MPGVERVPRRDASLYAVALPGPYRDVVCVVADEFVALDRSWAAPSAPCQTSAVYTRSRPLPWRTLTVSAG